MTAFLVAAVLAPAPASLTPTQLARVPPWASQAAREAGGPASDDAEVLLQQEEIAYLGHGRVRIQVRRAVHVLRAGGREERAMRIVRLGGRDSRLKRFRAWNARPDGDLEELERSDTISIDFGVVRLESFSLARVETGSLLAFESVIEEDHPMGPVAELEVLERHPIRLFELRARTEKEGIEVRLVGRHLEPWTRPAEERRNETLILRNLPARPVDEAETPHPRNALPWVHVSFHDAWLGDEAPSSATWSSLAAWLYAQYLSRAKPTTPTAASGNPTARLRELHAALSRRMTYRQVYLTPERGWIPLPADEVERRSYGDCKDLSTLFIARARGAGFAAHPVLARIGEGYIEPEEPPSAFAFNHAITAVRLQHSLGLKAEVETAAGRFLLIDPTSRFVPLGFLDPAHARRRVLISTEAGGVWAEVPEAAVVFPRRRLQLRGEIAGDGSLTAALAVSEEGGPLRAALAQRGEEALRRACLQLGIPASARCDVEPGSDPFDLERPFEATFRIGYPNALRPLGRDEWALVLPGLPAGWEPIQKPGQPRRLPVSSDERSRLDWEAHLKLPRPFAPVLPSGRFEGAFSQWTWACAVEAEAAGGELRASLAFERRPAFYGFDHREDGVAAWKTERNALRRLREDGPAVRAPAP